MGWAEVRVEGREGRPMSCEGWTARTVIDLPGAFAAWREEADHVKAYSEPRENRVKAKLHRGEPAVVVGGLNTPDIVDFLGSLGMDGVLIEGEHGPIDFADVPDMSRACDLWGMTSLVRVNLNVSGVIYRTLDVGAQGIIVPHVNTAADARAMVDSAKFGPIGSRGMFGANRRSYGVDSYVSKANDETMLVALIEESTAIDHLDEILAVDHIDAFCLGPGDLAQTMGYPGQPNHPDVQAAVDRAIAQVVGADRVAGVLVNDSNVEAYIDKGARFLLTSWTPWLASGVQGFQQKVAAAAGPRT